MAKKKLKRLGDVPAMGAVRIDEESGFQPVAGELPLYEDSDGKPRVEQSDLEELVKTSLGKRLKSVEGESPEPAKGKSQAGYSGIPEKQWDRIFGKKKRPKQG